MATNKIVSEHETKMKKAVEVLQSNLKALRSGRASTGLVEHLKVDYYGSPTPLKQLATLATPQSDLIVIKPFDPSSLKEIEKAIKNTDLSIAPIVEGKVIRLNIPPLSQERRSQLVAQAKQNGEQTKVSIRNIRRDANKQLEREEKEKMITEDERDESKKRIDDITKEYSAKIEAIVKAKTDEIMFD
jgi:ribosome recycling factor